MLTDKQVPSAEFPITGNQQTTMARNTSAATNVEPIPEGRRSRSSTGSSFQELSRKVSMMIGGTNGFQGGRKVSRTRKISFHRWDPPEKPKEPPKVAVENTYRMDPEYNINPTQIQKVMDTCLEQRLKGVHYSPYTGSILAQVLSDEIKTKIKELAYPRHRIICHVMIASQEQPTLTCASRFLWNSSVDNYVTTSYKGYDFYAVASVYGVYLE